MAILKTLMANFGLTSWSESGESWLHENITSFVEGIAFKWQVSKGKTLEFVLFGPFRRFNFSISLFLNFFVSKITFFCRIAMDHGWVSFGAASTNSPPKSVALPTDSSRRWTWPGLAVRTDHEQKTRAKWASKWWMCSIIIDLRLPVRILCAKSIPNFFFGSRND